MTEVIRYGAGGVPYKEKVKVETKPEPKVEDKPKKKKKKVIQEIMGLSLIHISEPTRR